MIFETAPVLAGLSTGVVVAVGGMAAIRAIGARRSSVVVGRTHEVGAGDVELLLAVRHDGSPKDVVERTNRVSSRALLFTASRVPLIARPLQAWSRRREASIVVAGLAPFAESVARHVSSGLTLGIAFDTAIDECLGPLATDLHVIQHELRAGSSWNDALDRWSRRRGSEEVSVLCGVLRIAHSIGGEIAASVDACAALLRDRAEVADEVRSLTSQSRASAMLLTGLPWCAAGAFTAFNPATADFLTATFPGVMCLVVALAAEIVGWRWMASLTRAVR